MPDVYAEVNHGRWLVRCPYCLGAELVYPPEPGRRRAEKTFFCRSCKNQSNGGRPLPVTWPEEMNEIENILAGRPNAANRNWRPGESLALLHAENIEHRVIEWR